MVVHVNQEEKETMIYALLICKSHLQKAKEHSALLTEEIEDALENVEELLIQVKHAK